MIELFLLKDLEKDFPYRLAQSEIITVDSQVSALQWRILKSVTFVQKQTVLFLLDGEV